MEKEGLVMIKYLIVCLAILFYFQGIAKADTNVRKSEVLVYDDGETLRQSSPGQGGEVAVKFTPSNYPVRLDRIYLYILYFSGTQPYENEALR